jgi:hypothetical protein
MLQQQQGVVDLARRPLRDQRPLKLDALGIADNRRRTISLRGME